MNKYRSKKNKQYDIKNKTIKRQADEIESLRKMVFDLKIECEGKDNKVNSIDDIRNSLLEIIEDLKNKREKYDKLNCELMEMRDAVNQIVFKKKWKLVRLLLKLK